MEFNNESFQQVHEIPLCMSVRLNGDKSSPVLTDSNDYEMVQDRPQNRSQEGLIQNGNDEPSMGTSPFSDPPPKDKDTKNVKRKRYEPDILREPQNKLPKISNPSSCLETLPEGRDGRVETLSQCSTKKQKERLQENSSERPWSCKFCEYRSNLRSADLLMHERTHTGEKPYQCGSCDYTAKSRQAMSYHLKTHAGEKPFKCQHCNYSATDRSTLQSHERTHTGEKPYKCKQCSYSARHLGTLRSHERTHTGEKPYKCKHCSYSATQSSSLRNHERTHTGEKPYQRGSCDFIAKSCAVMLYHLKTHAREHNL